MAAVTLLTSIFNTTAGSKGVSGTPAVGDLIVLVTGHTGYTAATAPTDNNAGGGGTYTNVVSALKATSADRADIWVRSALMTSATSTTFTHNAAGSTGGGILVFKVTGMDRAGTAAIKSSGSQANQASGTPAPVLSATPLTGNPVISAVFNATNPAGTTIPSSFTDRSNTGYATPTAGIRGVSRDSGQTNATITWGGASASAFASVAVELDTSFLQTLVVDLMQGASVIATWTHNPTTTWTYVGNVLSSGQVASITDYAALRLRFTATGAGGTRSRVSWAQLEVPGVPGDMPAMTERPGGRRGNTQIQQLMGQ